MQTKRVRLVLVNPMDDLHRKYSSALITQPPLSLGALYALTPTTIDVSILDEQVDTMDYDGDVFAFSLTTQLARKVYAISDRLRKEGKKVILGGYHVTTCPEEAQKHADSILTGEAERLWPRLCEDLLNATLKPRYYGSPADSNEMPIIHREGFKGKKYAFPGAIYASRGCPFACSFCGSSRLLGSHRCKSIESVSKEIDAIRAQYGDVILQFTDDNLLANKEWRKEFLTLMREKKTRWVSQASVDQLCDRELIDELAVSGCLAIASGIETLDTDDTRSVNKIQNLNMPIADAVRYVTSKGIHVAALLIFGLESDTPQRVKSTIQRLKEIPFSAYDATILRPFPGTELYDQMLKQGTAIPEWWNMAEPHPTNKVLPGYLRIYFDHQHLTPKQLQECALDAIDQLNRASPAQAMTILKIGMKSRNLWFATKMLAGRLWISRRAREWKQQVSLAPESGVKAALYAAKEEAKTLVNDPISIEVAETEAARFK
jgi:radical SAM superfamily enzyme YgiQ (UPF0313 family)